MSPHEHEENQSVIMKMFYFKVPENNIAIAAQGLGFKSQQLPTGISSASQLLIFPISSANVP